MHLCFLISLGISLIAWQNVSSAIQPHHPLRVEAVQAPLEKEAENLVEFRGVAAGAFVPEHWQAGTLHLLADQRRPLLAPREGPWRNIYAPSAVETPEGWRLFYGAWDGAPTGNDRIYSTITADFLSFDDRQTIIEHGPFHHVCNVNALRHDDGAFSMVCTAYPDPHGRNKPIFFQSPDGKTWNGHDAPYTATADDLVMIEGYENYADADINGMNVLLHEEGQFRLYFADFRNFGKIFRASSTDGRRYQLDGAVLDARLAPNDVKRFPVGGQNWYLMGLHMNTGRIYYALSTDGLTFSKPQELHGHRDESDQYMVAVGWVVRGKQEGPGRQLLGVLYGAGAVPSLDQNRIFASWLQQKVVFVTDDGQRFEPTVSFGPDRQRMQFPGSEPLKGRLELYRPDGQTLLAVSQKLTLQPGRAYRVGIETPR